jgi:hypothetical protein
MVARNTNVPFNGRIQMRKTNHLQIVTFGLQRAAGPYKWAKGGSVDCFVPNRSRGTTAIPSRFCCTSKSACSAPKKGRKLQEN